ncbi:hypothetical protein FKP32DRAFT_1173365 [Trametes sanguinea]|nr:hypothetical protein FKP32DRAFT_1173365 [Trametes sanguinea]
MHPARSLIPTTLTPARSVCTCTRPGRRRRTRVPSEEETWKTRSSTVGVAEAALAHWALVRVRGENHMRATPWGAPPRRPYLSPNLRRTHALAQTGSTHPFLKHLPPSGPSALSFRYPLPDKVCEVPRNRTLSRPRPLLVHRTPHGAGDHRRYRPFFSSAPAQSRPLRGKSNLSLVSRARLEDAIGHTWLMQYRTGVMRTAVQYALPGGLPNRLAQLTITASTKTRSVAGTVVRRSSTHR